MRSPFVWRSLNTSLMTGNSSSTLRRAWNPGGVYSSPLLICCSAPFHLSTKARSFKKRQVVTSVEATQKPCWMNCANRQGSFRTNSAMLEAYHQSIRPMSTWNCTQRLWLLLCTCIDTIWHNIATSTLLVPPFHMTFMCTVHATAFVTTIPLINLIHIGLE